ncbi:MAG: hypothetical protein KBT36_06925 [Kurthia sp.]|nr:hypothetical protein [Candidatus Kurthia equi]
MTSDLEKMWTEEDVPTYSLDETMQLLNVGKTALNNLAQKRIIIEIENPTAPNSNRMKRSYTIESVDRYKAFLDSHVTVATISNEFSMPRTSVFNLLRQHELPYNVDAENFVKRTAYVTKDIYLTVVDILNDRKNATFETRRKADFYSKGYGLFQPFNFPNGQQKRLQFNEQLELGFFGPEGFERVESAVKNGAIPHYQISKSKTFPKNHYMQLQVSVYNRAIYLIIDQAYQQIGYKNMYIKVANNKIHLFLKQTALKSTRDPIDKAGDFDEIQWETGAFEWNGDDLVLKSGLQVHSVFMEDELAEVLSAYAKEHNMRVNDVIKQGFELLKREVIQ